MASSFDFRGLHCFAPATEEGAWSFLPAAPDLQRGGDGQPMFTLVDLGPSAYLLFTASWGAPADDVQALREEIAARQRGRDADPVRLAYAPLAATQCNVLVGDGSGGFSAVATSATSCMPPYDAVFNLFLQEDRLAHARAGLRGERGHLAIEYLAQLRMPVSARATFRATAERLAPFLRARDGAEGDLERQLEQAIASGAATIVVDAPNPCASALALDLYHRVLARAAERVADASGDLQITVTLEQEVSVPTRAFADVGTLVSAEAQGSLIGGHHAAD
jgi:hypothetical protein